ncbi:hypothetical protein RIF29_09756 [Crotalaria pallida]|uniref:Uncharacterized protein n=1 Tax=Crotalaria pallida TaxID=3830 RepID=A0AAN9FV91_CROPI
MAGSQIAAMMATTRKRKRGEASAPLAAASPTAAIGAPATPTPLVQTEAPAAEVQVVDPLLQEVREGEEVGSGIVSSGPILPTPNLGDFTNMSVAEWKRTAELADNAADTEAAFSPLKKRVDELEKSRNEAHQAAESAQKMLEDVKGEANRRVKELSKAHEEDLAKQKADGETEVKKVRTMLKKRAA